MNILDSFPSNQVSLVHKLTSKSQPMNGSLVNDGYLIATGVCEIALCISSKSVLIASNDNPPFNSASFLMISNQVALASS